MKKKIFRFVSILAAGICFTPVLLMPSALVCSVANSFIGASANVTGLVTILLAFVGSMILIRKFDLV